MNVLVRFFLDIGEAFDFFELLFHLIALEVFQNRLNGCRLESALLFVTVFDILGNLINLSESDKSINNFRVQ